MLLHPFVGDVKGHPFKGDEAVGDERIWDISPLVGVPNDTVNERGYPEINQDAVTKGKWELAQKHFITDGLPLELLPEGSSGGSFYKYRANGEVLIKSGAYPIVAAKNYGKGRVVALAYRRRIYATERQSGGNENLLGLLGVSILAPGTLDSLGLGREVDVRIKELTAKSDSIQLNVTSQRRDVSRLKSTALTSSGRHLVPIAARTIWLPVKTTLSFRPIL